MTKKVGIIVGGSSRGLTLSIIDALARYYIASEIGGSAKKKGAYTLWDAESLTADVCAARHDRVPSPPHNYANRRGYKKLTMPRGSRQGRGTRKRR